MISVSPGRSTRSDDDENPKPNGPATFGSTDTVELPMFWMLTCWDNGHAPDEPWKLNGCGVVITRLAPRIVASRSTVALPAFDSILSMPRLTSPPRSVPTTAIGGRI